VADSHQKLSPDQELATLLSLAVHEFRTPASVVGGYLRMLQRDTSEPLPARQKKMVDEAEKAFARLVGLVNELSDIGKLEDGRLSLQQKPLDLFDLAGQVAADTHEAEDRGVRLEVRGSTTGAHLVGDEVRLRHALESLFRAVLREQPSACVVVVEHRLATDRAGTGALIAIATADRIASAFEAPRAAFDETRGGMGLALPIARRIVERHGGEIWSQAAQDGQPASRSGIGMRFPLADRQAANTSVA
jgi:signal transduction histidine kinase